MKVKIQWIESQYPSFNVMIISADGMDPFITIKGCNIKTGPKGEFISYPSKKTNDGKYFNYIYASEKFNKVVMDEAKLAKPERSSDEPTRRSNDMADDIPF